MLLRPFLVLLLLVLPLGIFANPAQADLRPFQIKFPWSVSVNPDTIYVGPPQCSASFTVTVTVDQPYKTVTTNPLTIIILRDPDNPYVPSGFLFDGAADIPIKSGDWQTTVTALFTSPWEPQSGIPGHPYTLKVVVYPHGGEFSTYTDAAAIVTYIIQDTGVKTCSSVSSSSSRPQTCPDGQSWNGAQCVCPSGRQWNGQQCVTPPTCPDGQSWNGAQCVCPSGRQWNGQQCVTPPPPYNWWDCHYWWRWGQWSWCDWRWPWITQEPFDFTLEATPGQQTVKAGQSVTFTVAVTLVSGTSQLVTLSLPNPPAGVSYSFSLASGNPDFTSALKVSIDTTVPVGTQVLTITGTGGGKTHSTTVNVDVASNKEESSLSISINPATLRVGESVSVGGALTPSLTTSIELVYTRPDGFEMTKHVTITGAFSDTFNPDMPGSWSVKARWPGDSERYGSESQQERFTVEAAPEAPPSFWDMIGGPGTLVAAVIIIIALFVLLRHRSRSKSAALGKPLGKYCMKCGAAVPAGSDFCPTCGERTR